MTVENWFPTPVYYNDPARLVMFDGKIRHRATSYRNQPRITIAIKYSAQAMLFSLTVINTIKEMEIF